VAPAVGVREEDLVMTSPHPIRMSEKHLLLNNRRFYSTVQIVVLDIPPPPVAGRPLAGVISEIEESLDNGHFNHLTSQAGGRRAWLNSPITLKLYTKS
jgi:hypothetical protein